MVRRILNVHHSSIDGIAPCKKYCGTTPGSGEYYKQVTATRLPFKNENNCHSERNELKKNLKHSSSFIGTVVQIYIVLHYTF